MYIIKAKEKNNILVKAKDYEDTEVSVWVAKVPYESEKFINTKKVIFILHPDFGYVEVADLGKIYEKLLEDYRPESNEDETLNELKLVKLMNLTFHLAHSNAYEVGMENKTQKHMCFPVMEAFVSENSFDN